MENVPVTKRDTKSDQFAKTTTNKTFYEWLIKKKIKLCREMYPSKTA